jgi:hypothetical protein
VDLDGFEEEEFFNQPHSHHVWSRLRSPDSIQASGHTTSRESAYFGRLVLGYQLLDIMMWAAGFPPHPLLKTIPQCEARIIPVKLYKLIQSLTPSRFGHVLKAQLRIIPPESQINTEVTRGDHLDSYTFQIAMRNLNDAANHAKEQTFHTVMKQVYSVASILRWFSPVSICAESTPVPSHISIIAALSAGRNQRSIGRLHYTVSHVFVRPRAT